MPAFDAQLDVAMPALDSIGLQMLLGKNKVSPIWKAPVKWQHVSFYTPLAYDAACLDKGWGVFFGLSRCLARTMLHAFHI